MISLNVLLEEVVCYIQVGKYLTLLNSGILDRKTWRALSTMVFCDLGFFLSNIHYHPSRMLLLLLNLQLHADRHSKEICISGNE